MNDMRNASGEHDEYHELNTLEAELTEALTAYTEACADHTLSLDEVIRFKDRLDDLHIELENFQAALYGNPQQQQRS